MQSLECLFIRSASPRLFFRLLCQAYSVHVTMFTFYHFSCVFNDDHVTMPTICQFMFTCINSHLHVSMLSVSFFFVIRFVMFFFLIMRELCELSCARLVRYMRSCCLSVATLCLAMFHVSNIFFYSSFQSQRLPISYITMFRLLCLVVTFLEIMF